MTKWDYFVRYPGQTLRTNTYPEERAIPIADEVAFWAEIGDSGWELVAVEKGVAYFKRPRPT